MVVYGLLDFQGYRQKNQAIKYAELSQVVDNPDMDKSSVEYEIFGYGTFRTLNYQITTDRDDIPDILNKNPQARIIRIISYSPIITPKLALMMKLRATTLDEIHRGQLLMYDDQIFIDQYGMSVCVQNLLVLDDNDVQDYDLRFVDDYSQLIVEGDARTML